MTRQPHKADFQHDVFISYSRKDAAFARKLEKALEAYRPPKKTGLARRNLRVFRDESDMTGVEYYQSIDNHLRQTSKLLVICSPEAAASQYVNDEIRRFASSHSQADIIPILLDGLPYNEAGPDDHDQCAFPKALVEIMQMPLAIGYTGFDTARDRIGKGRFENAWYGLLANIYNLSRDEIEQRERKRIARRRFFITCLSFALIVVLSIALVITLLARNEAERKRILAESGQLANQALLTMRTDSTRALLQATESVRKAATANSLTVLRRAIQASKCEAVLPHGAPVRLVAYHHASGQIVTGGGDGVVRFWDSQSGRLIRQLQVTDSTDPGPIRSMTLNAPRNIIAAATSKAIRVYDLERLVEVQRFDSRHAGFRNIDLNTDGTLVLAAAGASWHVWSVGSGAKIGNAGGTIINMAAFNAKSDKIVACYDDGHEARVWDLKSEKEDAFISCHRGPVAKALFDPSGKWVVTMGTNAKAAITNIDTQARYPQSQILHRGKVNDVAFDETGLLATAGEDGTVRLWRDTNGPQIECAWKDIFVGTEHNGPVQQVVFSPRGGRLASVGRSGTIRIWQRTSTGRTEAWDSLTSFSLPFNRAYSASFSEDGSHLAVASGNSALMVFAIGEDCEQLCLKPPGAQSLNDVRFNSSGSRIVILDKYKAAGLWDSSNGQLIAEIGSKGVFTADGNRYLAASRGVVYWNASSGKALSSIDFKKWDPSFLPSIKRISPDGQFAVIVNLRELTDELWDLAIPDRLRSMGKNVQTWFVGIPSRWMVVKPKDKPAVVMETISGKTVCELAEAGTSPWRYRLSADGESIVGMDGENIHVWNKKTGTVVRVFHGQELLSAAVKYIDIFTCDKAVLADENGNLVLLRDYQKEAATTIRIGPDPLKTADISPDGTFLLTADKQGRVKLWTTADGSLQSTIPDLRDPIAKVKFNADGRRFAVVTESFVNLYVTRTDDLLELADSRVPLNYSADIADQNAWD